MKSLFIVVILALWTLVSWGQTSSHTQSGLKQNKVFSWNDPVVFTKYKDYNYQGKFAIQLEADALHNYYMVDMRQLPGQFERLYFLDQVSKSGKLVWANKVAPILDAWIQVEKQYQEKDIQTIFNSLKSKTNEKSLLLNENQKLDWLQSH